MKDLVMHVVAGSNPVQVNSFFFFVIYFFFKKAAIAQLGERQTEDLKVPGSIPGGGIDIIIVQSNTWGYSSIGRARVPQTRGTGIETRYFQLVFFQNITVVSLWRNGNASLS